MDEKLIEKGWNLKILDRKHILGIICLSSNLTELNWDEMTEYQRKRIRQALTWELG